MIGKPKKRKPLLCAWLPFIWILTIAISSSCAKADSIRVAVASNFSLAAKSLVDEFEASSGHTAKLLIGSTGKQFAQIQNGLAVDVFLAADHLRPELLETQGRGVAGTRFTFAIGRLVLWSANNKVSQSTLKELRGQRIAIANPKLAPYGLAAQQTMHSLGLSPARESDLVRGENVAQAYQFARTKNTPYAFVALSQVKGRDGHYWLVPTTLHQKIDQQAILLKDSKAGRSFLKFLRSDVALKLMRHHGYDNP